MTTLVTGATGNVGSNVVRELRDRGMPVRALVRGPDAAAALQRDGVDVAVGDFTAPATLRAAMKGVAQVFVASRNDPGQADCEMNVIDAATAGGARRIVKLSSIGAEVGSPLAFWDCHGRIARHLRAAGPPAVILQPNFYMSNLLDSAATVRDAGRFFLPGAGVRLAMIDPRDVAAAAAAVLAGDGHDGKTYVLTGPAAITFDDVARHLSEAVGRPVAFVPVHDQAAREGMIGSGMPAWMADNVVTLFGLLREGAASQPTGDVLGLTGRPPRGFDVFARDHAARFSA